MAVLALLSARQTTATGLGANDAQMSRHQPTKYEVKAVPSGVPAFLVRVSRMQVSSKLKEEFFKILPPTIYFFVALHLVMFIVLLRGRPPIKSYSQKSSWPHFWAIQIILFVLIAVYCTMHELARVIGKEKILRIFFGPMPAPQV